MPPLRALLALVPIAGLMSAACGGGPSQVETETGPVRIMPLGDSITLGYGVGGGYRLPLRNLLAPRLPFTFVGSLATNSEGLDRPGHEGHSGWTILDFIGEGDQPSETGVSPVARYMRDATPDVVLLLLGTNDGDVGAAEYERRYRALLGDIYAATPNVRVAFMEVTPRGGGEPRVEQAREAALAVVPEFRARGKRIVLIDPRGVFDPGTMLADGLHPNALGYATVADLFESAIESLER